FPRLPETVDAFELVHPTGLAQFVEQTPSADRLELMVVADERESPLLVVGEDDEVSERRGADRASLVDEHGRAGGKPELWVGWAVGAVPLVEELGERVGRDTGLAVEDARPWPMEPRRT